MRQILAPQQRNKNKIITNERSEKKTCSHLKKSRRNPLDYGIKCRMGYAKRVNISATNELLQAAERLSECEPINKYIFEIEQRF